MALQYWFASLLTDPSGVWKGCLLRPDGAQRTEPEDLSALHDWVSEHALTSAPLILPADPEHAGWLPQTASSYPRLTEVMAGTQRIVLDTAKDTGWAFSPGVSLADAGFLLQRPVSAPGRPGTKMRRSPVQLIQLLADIERDADTRELEKVFRTDPELSFQLLRLLNSAAFGMRTKVTSLGHAITLLGRRQLQRWLQLLIYAQPDAPATAPNPLLQLAAYRGHLLEGMAKKARRSSDDADAAYMIGIFSLLDRIIAQPLAKIVAQLPLAPVVMAALIRGEGALGETLAVAVSAERGDLSAAATLLTRLALSPEDWLAVQIDAYQWAYSLGENATTTEAKS